MERIKWTESDVKEIKIAMGGVRNSKAERLSRRLGVDMQSVRDKIGEIKESRRVRRIAGKLREKTEEYL